jgi:hypothetical protein
LQTFDAHMAREISRIIHHPRYSTLSQQLQSKRPDQEVNNILIHRLMSLEFLFAVQQTALKEGAPSTLLQQGRLRILESLDELAYLLPLHCVRLFPFFQHLSILTFFLSQNLFASRPIAVFALAPRVIATFGFLAEPYLREWVAGASTEKREKCVLPSLLHLLRRRSGS